MQKVQIGDAEMPFLRVGVCEDHVPILRDGEGLGNNDEYDGGDALGIWLVNRWCRAKLSSRELQKRSGVWAAIGMR